MSERATGKPNVVLLVSDSLRAKNMGSYGYERDTDPFLKSMASKYTKAENYVSNAPWTVPAHASIFSGKLPSEHGTNSGSLWFKSKNKLCSKFREKGYSTVCISENGLVNPDLGFGSEFDEFIDASIRGGSNWKNLIEGDYDSKSKKWSEFFSNVILDLDIVSLRSFVENLLEEKLDINFGEDYNPTQTQRTISRISRIMGDFQSDEESFFIFANLMATHYTYTFNNEQKQKFLPNVDQDKVKRLTKHGEFSEFIEEHGRMSLEEIEAIRASYDASINYVDSLIEQLFQEAPQDTIFVVIGDHGEIIGERQYKGYPVVEHHFGTFDELIKVPFICFPKKLDIEGLLDHRSLPEFFEKLIQGETKFKFSEVSFSEYYGRRRFNDSFGIEIPKGFEELYSRESFSIVKKDCKMEFISDNGILVDDDSINPKEGDLEFEIPFVLKTILDDRNLI